jgi:hypothetical protein
MGGVGPPPEKDKRNRGGTKLEQINHPDFEVPELPKSYRLIVWVDGKSITKTLTYLAETRRWWEAWQRSPIADELAEVHWLRLLSVAKLKDRYERDPSPKNAGELRLQEAAFGGTPMDLRRTGRIIHKPSTHEAEGPGAEVIDADDARRARLQSVKTG